MKFTPQEKRLTLGLGFVILFGITGFATRARLEAWKTAREQLEQARQELARREALIASGERWERRFHNLSGLMPLFEPDRKLDTHWMSLMDRIAARHNLSIIRRQAGKEERIGDVYEMPIECREWQGSLESLVGFLYDLQSEGIMLDMRYLYMRPRQTGNPDSLRGRFELYAAYMRGEYPVTASDAASTTAGNDSTTNTSFITRR